MATSTVNTSTWGLFVHQGKNGTLTVVDSAGKAIASPPDVKVGVDGSFAVVGSTSLVTLPAYSPPIHNVFAYTAPNGTVTIVDASGNSVPIPPNTAKTPGGDLVIVDSSGQVIENAGGPIEIPAFSPPIANVFLMEAGPHQIYLVDATGNFLDCQPNCVWSSDGQWVFADASGKALLSGSGQEMVVPTFPLPTLGVHIYDGLLVDGHGNPLPQNMNSDQRWDWNSIPEYSPPTTGVFLHTASDGTTTVVDAAGKPIPSPPLIDKNGGVIGFDSEDVVDPNTGAQIVLPPYSPPTTGIYLFASDRDVTVVDAAGNLVPSPPRVEIVGGQYVLTDSSGKPLLGNDENPISVPVYDPTSAPRLLVHTASDGTVQVVDATGQPVSSPPTVALHPGTGEPAIVDANGQFVLDSQGNLTTLPAYSPPTQGVYAHVLRDPLTGAMDVQIVDSAGSLVQSPPGFVLKPSGDPSDPPTVVLVGADGKPLADTDGIPISAPLYSPPTQGVYAHVLRDPLTGAMDVQIVDSAGSLVQSPPGYVIKPSGDPSDPPTVVLVGADGKPLADTDGIPISAPLYSPPTQGVYAHVLRDPLTGAMDVQIVDSAGSLVQSPPGYVIKPSGDPSDPPTVVLVGADGKPLADTDGIPISAPLYSPPTQGVYAHVLRDPLTGAMDVQIVDSAGSLVQSPPGYVIKPSGDPSDPPTVVLVGADGKPLADTDGIPISAPLYSPPTQGIFAHVVTDPLTGEMDVQIVDSAGNLVQSPPGYVIKQMDPEEPPEIILTGVDGKPITGPDGNPVSVPLDESSATPPGVSPPAEEDTTDSATDLPAEGETTSDEEDARGERDTEEEVEPIPGEELSGAREETPTGTPTEEVSHVDHWSSESGERVAVADLSGRAADAIVSDEEPVTRELGETVGDEADPEVRGEPEEAEAGPGDPAASAEEETTSKGRSAEPEVEAEPAVVKADRVGLVEERAEAVSSRVGEVASSETVEPVKMGEVEAVGPVGLGAEELVEMVSGPVAEEGEVAAREEDGPSAGGEQVLEIPDLLAPELDRKGDDRPVPGPGDVEFRVEVAPAEEVVDAEPIAEVVEVDSVTGLGSDELRGVLTGSDATIAAEEAGEGIVERVEAEGSRLGEEVPELKWGTEVGAGSEASLAGEAVEPDLEGKPIPVLELEEVEFKVEMAPAEEAVAEFRVEVADAGTLEIDEEAAGGLARVVEEPEDQPVGRYLTEEEPEEEEEIQP